MDYSAVSHSSTKVGRDERISSTSICLEKRCSFSVQHSILLEEKG